MDVKSSMSVEVSKNSGLGDSNSDVDKRVDVGNKTDSQEKFRNPVDDRLDVSNKPEKSTESKNDDVDKRVETAEKEVNGGAYSDVFTPGEGETKEVHHMPADSASYLERDDGPAIKMDKADHRRTANCGSSREAKEYQAAQKELIDNGKFREALQMDIDDVTGKFPGKYDEAISEMLKYVDKLEMEGKI